MQLNVYFCLGIERLVKREYISVWRYLKHVQDAVKSSNNIV